MVGLRQLVVGLVLLAFLGTPAAACMIAASHMTPSEEECCREMAGECGETIMPVAHSCCPAVKRDDSATAAAKAQKVAPVLVAVALPQFALDADRAPLPRPAEHSPPESPPGANSILRI